MKISLDQIIISEDSLRQKFDEKGLRSLGESIKQYGQVHPIIVRPKGDMYELVVGERRFRAHKLIGFDTIEAQIRDVDDSTAMELRLIENTEREDLTEAEKGEAVAHLLVNFPEKYPTVKSLAEKLKKGKKTISVWLRKSARLSEEVKKCIRSKRLSERSARSLLKFSHPEQNKLVKAIVRYKIKPGADAEKHREFINRYEMNPEKYPTVESLEELANEVKGVKKVKIDLSKLSPDARKEVEGIVEDTKKDKKKIVPPDEERCIALTAKRTRCLKRRLPNKQYCSAHDPERERRFGRPKKPKNKNKTEQYESPTPLPDEPPTPLPIIVDVEVKVITAHLSFPLPLWEKIAEYQATQKPMMLADAIIALLETHPALMEK